MNILFTIGFLIILEGMLSMDNALALAVLVRHLPKERQAQALTWGIYGAFIFRVIAVIFASYLMHATAIKLFGGTYLIYVAIKGLWCSADDKDVANAMTASFWKTIILVELTDISFSMDSILAAVGVSNNIFVVIIGGCLGIVMMRLVASFFIHLLNLFPWLERVAFWLVGAIGIKLLLEAL